jgi:adenosine deaminase
MRTLRPCPRQRSAPGLSGQGGCWSSGKPSPAWRVWRRRADIGRSGPPRKYAHVSGAHFHSTIHADEAFGLPSIAEALHVCGTERLGHGVRIIDDITVGPDGNPKLGQLAAYVRDTRVPLELCPTSNVHVGAVRSVADHPIGLLAKLRFRVTVNTDNRLMSQTCLTDEFTILNEAFGWSLDDVRWATINAMKSAFLPFEERLALIDNVIKPGFAALGADGRRG